MSQECVTLGLSIPCQLAFQVTRTGLRHCILTSSGLDPEILKIPSRPFFFEEMVRELSRVADVEAVGTIIAYEGTMFLAQDQRETKAVV
jgi:hypothetical protein